MEHKQSSPLWRKTREFICGSWAGVGLILAGHPLDTIKVRLQAEGTSGRFGGPIDCLMKTVRNEGFFGLYKGALGPLIGQGTISATQFGLLGIFLPMIKKDKDGKGTLGEIWLAGTMAGTFMWIPVAPIEGIKARLQMQYLDKSQSKYKGTVDAWKKVYKEWGIRGLFKGGVPTFWQRLSFGWYVWGYEGSRRFLTNNNPEAKLSPLATITAGICAGTVFWISCYPFDVIKNRIQGSPDVHPPIYNGMIDCAQKIYAKEGWKGFFRGFSVCLLRSAPANSTTFLFLELARKFLPE